MTKITSVGEVVKDGYKPASFMVGFDESSTLRDAVNQILVEYSAFRSKERDFTQRNAHGPWKHSPNECEIGYFDNKRDRPVTELRVLTDESIDNFTRVTVRGDDSSVDNYIEKFRDYVAKQI